MLAIIIILLLCTYNVITYKSELNGKTATSKIIAKETIVQYKHMIFVLFVLGIASDSFTNFGTGGLIITIVLALCSHRLGLIPFFTNKEGDFEEFSGVIPDRIATKTCTTRPAGLVKGGGIFGGGSIKTKLVKIGKHIRKNQNR